MSHWKIAIHKNFNPQKNAYRERPISEIFMETNPRENFNSLFLSTNVEQQAGLHAPHRTAPTSQDCTHLTGPHPPHRTAHTSLQRPDSHGWILPVKSYLFRRRGWARTEGRVKTKDTPTAREKLSMLRVRSVSRNIIRARDLAIRHSLAVTRHLGRGAHDQSKGTWPYT